MSQNDPRTDAELMALAKKDPRAFEAVYVRHAVLVKQWLVRRLGSEQIALELTAETFAQAWGARRRFEAPDSQSAAPWLLGIANNLYRTWAHDQRVESKARERLQLQVPEIEASADEVAERLIADSLGPRVAEAMASLPIDQAAAINLRIIDELPYEQVAERLNCTQEAARMRVMRGLRTLSASVEVHAR